jgi:predicted dehydrogenase
MLADKFLPRARQLRDKYQVPAVVDDYREVIGRVDAAIVALPNNLHATVTIDLLRHGIHVLVEKPMALRTTECDEMIEAARSADAVLAVGLDFRFFHASQFLKRLFENRLLGDIKRFDLHLGIISKWPSTSDFLFRKEASGGGVLMDWGVHVLDLLLWWLGDYDRVDYYDDAIGGVEADCKVHLDLQCGASGVVELSRTRNLKNTCRVHGERGSLEFAIWDADPFLRLQFDEQGLALNGRVTGRDGPKQTMREVFPRQLNDFIDAIVDHREPLIPGQEGMRAVKLIEACYASRKPLEYPWACLERAISARAD